MKGWTQIETGWYTHPSGAVVQRWWNYNAMNSETGWFAWRPGDKNDAGKPFRTMREACAFALDDPRPRQASGETTGYSGGVA